MSEARKPVPPRIFRGPQPDVALPDIPLGRQLRAVPEVGLPGKGAVDLTGKPKFIMALGSGNVGKSLLLRYIAEMALERDPSADLTLAAVDPDKRDLPHYFAGVAQPDSYDPAHVAVWVESLMAHCIEKHASAAVDFGGGDTSLARLVAQQDDLCGTMEQGGVHPVALYVVGPRVGDLTALSTMEQSGFRPAATAIILNPDASPLYTFLAINTGVIDV